MDTVEVARWLGQPRAPIRRAGSLTANEVAEATTAFFGNSKSLFEEALTLQSLGRVQRACALTVLGLEELAKVPLLTNTFLRFQVSGDEGIWSEFWNHGGQHRRKQKEIANYGQIIRTLFDRDSLHEKQLYRHYADEILFANLDWFKQANFYVDVRTDGIHSPDTSLEKIGVMDFLLTFGQERLDSFGSWHTTPFRSVDFISTIKSGRGFKDWTQQFSIPEIEADILYQASSLSASRVPNYATFVDFVSEYQGIAPHQEFRDAVLHLAADINGRIRRGRTLELYYSRNLGILKLLLGLCHSDIHNGLEFADELKEVLTQSAKGEP